MNGFGEIPDDVAGLTPGFVTAALRSAGVLDEVAVDDVTCEPIVEGRGFVGSTYRCRLTYGPGAGINLPRSVVAKFPCIDPALRRLFDRFGLYEREAGFYRDLRRKTPLPTARCYYSRHDSKNGNFLLLLEDLHPAHPADRARGLTVEQAERALRELARMHARWWEDLALSELAWLPLPNSEPLCEILQAEYPPVWSRFEMEHGDKLPVSILKLGRALVTALPAVLDRLATPPLTLVHGDYQVGNIFFGDTGAITGVIDWQVPLRGRGAADVAHLVVRSLPPADRARAESGLLESYHDGLRAEGVAYPLEECRLDYDLSLIAEFALSLILSSMLATTAAPAEAADEERSALSRIGEVRFFAALADLDWEPVLASVVHSPRRTGRRRLLRALR